MEIRRTNAPSFTFISLFFSGWFQNILNVNFHGSIMSLPLENDTGEQ